MSVGKGTLSTSGSCINGYFTSGVLEAEFSLSLMEVLVPMIWSFKYDYLCIIFYFFFLHWLNEKVKLLLGIHFKRNIQRLDLSDICVLDHLTQEILNGIVAKHGTS